MFALNEKWAAVLRSLPETGMGYQRVSVVLRNGRQLDDVMVVGGIVTGVAGQGEIPFTDEEIVDIRITCGR